MEAMLLTSREVLAVLELAGRAPKSQAETLFLAGVVEKVDAQVAAQLKQAQVQAPRPTDGPQ